MGLRVVRRMVSKAPQKTKNIWTMLVDSSIETLSELDDMRSFGEEPEHEEGRERGVRLSAAGPGYHSAE